MHLQDSLVVENAGAGLGRDDVYRVLDLSDLTVSENLDVGIPVLVINYSRDVVDGSGRYNNQWCFVEVDYIGLVADEIVVDLDHHLLVAMDGLDSVSVDGILNDYIYHSLFYFHVRNHVLYFLNHKPKV